MEKIVDKKYPLVNQVTDTERVSMVKEIFSTINRKYDFLNHFLSARRDVAWRRFAVSKMGFLHTYRFLDVATGTSDLAIETALRYPNIQVVALDFVKEMIDIGERKIERENLSTRIKMVKGDALSLPLASHSFDAAGIAFGIRNIPDKISALKEMLRVVVPGGQVLVLEMTSPQTRLIKAIYHMYLNKILPLLARAFSSNPNAYYYLGDSIMHFPTPHGFARLMEHAGLVDIEMYSLTLGITHLHIGHKPRTE